MTSRGGCRTIAFTSTTASSPVPGRRGRRLARAGAAIAAAAAFGGFAGGVASADAAPTLGAPSPAVSCWSEYEFYRSGNTLYATGVKDCVHDGPPQKLPVKIQMWYSDEYYTGWMNWSSGIGVATAKCNPYWPATYRHSVTHEQIYC
jgi:hypothetical protein